MGDKNIIKKTLSNNDYLEVNKRLKLLKNTKWVSYGTYIMIIEGFGYEDGIKDYQPLMGTFEYKSASFVVNAKYDNESYYIDSKELYNNVSKGDKIVVTIKYHYDEDENLIYSTIHKFHPFPISNQ